MCVLLPLEACEKGAHMINLLYSITDAIYAVILLIFFIRVCKLDNRSDEGVAGAFKRLLLFMIFYCLQDSLWGAASIISPKVPSLFYAASVVFHVSTALAPPAWTFFLTGYLDDKSKFRGFFRYLCSVLFTLQMTVIIINFFTPILFTVSATGEYVPGTFRYLAYIIQSAYLLLAAICVFIASRTLPKEERHRHLAAALFILPLLACVFLQYFFVFGPFYSIGLFVASCIVYVFAFSAEREAGLSKTNRRNLDILRSMVAVYAAANYVDFTTGTVIKLNDSEENYEYLPSNGQMRSSTNQKISEYICEEHKAAFLSYTDLQTLPERLSYENTISRDFMSAKGECFRCRYFVVKKDKNGKVTSAAYAIRDVSIEKNEADRLRKLALEDTLTGLLNRQAFESAAAAFRKQQYQGYYLFAMIDINGLKKTNDELGHDAGDELIKGVAECMLLSAGSSGNIYRIGGDEFAAILFSNPENCQAILERFESFLDNWSGDLVKKASVSIGYASKLEFPDATFDELKSIADKRMYQNKADYYKKHDRRA